jgi:hypothetical protein
VLDPHVELGRFNVGRPRDHLMTPFQCELCHFWNIHHQNPIDSLATDQEAMEFFCRASLDAFWRWTTSTVLGNLTEGKRGQ